MDTHHLQPNHGPDLAADLALATAEGRALHQDLGAIPPTELDGITINRTKSGLSPFVPIRKERLVDQLTGAPSRSFGVWVQDPDSDDGWRDMGTVSEQYLLLPNEEVRGLALEIAQASGLPYRESRIFWDGARFAHIVDFVETTEPVGKDDPVGLSLVTRSSYDRSWRYECALMGKRFVCDNGMISGEFFARVHFKHVASDGAEPWQDVVRQGLAVLDHGEEDLARFAELLRRLRRTTTTDRHLRAIWSELAGLNDTAAGRIVRRYTTEEEPTLYGLLNAGTQVFWHSDKLTASDFGHNAAWVDGLLSYAQAHLN